MFINMDGIFETYKVDVETYIEDRMINKQTIQAPKENLLNYMNKLSKIKDLLK